MTQQASEAAAIDPADPVPEPGDAAELAAGSTDPYEAMHAVDPEGADALRTEWGDDFVQNIDLARSAAEAFAGSGVIEVLDEAGIGDDPRIVRAAAEIGRLLQGGRVAEGPAGADGREALESELEKLVGSADYWSERAQRRVRQIYLKLHGSADVPVHRSPGDAGGRK